MNYNICSPIFKLSKGDKVLVDTNILLMVFYSPYIQQNKPYKQAYQNFFYSCINSKVILYTTQENIREALHVIDNISLTIYNKQNKKQLKLKDFHKISAEVKNVHRAMELFYMGVKQAVNIILNEDMNQWINDYFQSTNCIDLNDYDLIKTAQRYNIKNILTDDCDFVTDINLINGLNLLSQNSKILNLS